MNTIGNELRLTVFGESHGPAVGCTLDGIPAGFCIDSDAVAFELSRRAPHSGVESTKRKEADAFEIVSGVYNGVCTGAPLTAIFKNNDARSEDYSLAVLRPSHADLTAAVKYRGHNDPRGGGMFSGRLTLPLVFAGAVCRQLLSRRGIHVGSHVLQVGSIADAPFDPMMTAFPELDPFFPLVDPGVKSGIDELFADLRRSGNSVGGMVECAALGVPVGLGEPFFNGLESMIAHMLFSIPGVHGVDFGAGFGFPGMLGSEANDPILPDLSTSSNHSGGINGGISNGMPLIMRAAFRPVPSIALPQRSIDPSTGQPATLELRGRHDVCILPRGCAAIEAATALALCDALLSFEGKL